MVGIFQRIFLLKFARTFHPGFQMTQVVALLVLVAILVVVAGPILAKMVKLCKLVIC